MTLEDDLQEIDGVGPATAAKIVDVVEQHDSPDLDSDELAYAKDQAIRGNEREVLAFLNTLG